MRGYKYLLLSLLFMCNLSYANTVTLGTVSADATAGGINNNFTTLANVLNGTVEGSTDSGISVSNIKADSIFEINMADDANGRVRDSELFNITVDTISGGAVASQGTVIESGCVPATDSDLTSDVSACVAYVNGYRVSKAATAQTYGNNTTTYLWLSQSGVYTQSTNANTTVANSALLASVVTSGGQITTVTTLFTSRVPGLIIPSHYRVGMVVSQDSTTVLRVRAGSAEVNNSILSKTTDTTLTISTAGDWAGGSSLRATSTMAFVGLDTSGNLKLHTTAPTHSNYAVSATAGKKRYATWSSTVYRILGWFYMNATGSGEIDSFGIGNIKEADVPNSLTRYDNTANTLDDTTYGSDIANTTINFYSSGGPVTFDAIVSADAANTLTTLTLDVDGTDKANSEAQTDEAAAKIIMPLLFGETPNQGSHTVTIQGKVASGSRVIGAKRTVLSEM